MTRVDPFLDDVFETFRRTSSRPCNAAEAVALEIYKPPLTRRFFYALMKWGILVMALAAIGVMLSGCDTQAAEIEDAEALSSREWAGQQVCGPAATAVWHGDKQLECLPTRTPMAVQR